MSVKNTIEGYPEKVQDYILALRSLILDVAISDTRIGNLEETLKWGEPAYLTPQTKSGTTIRLAWKEKKPERIGVFVHCQTTLIQDFKAAFPYQLNYEGNRAIWIDLDMPLRKDILKLFISKALTYHLEDELS